MPKFLAETYLAAAERRGFATTVERLRSAAAAAAGGQAVSHVRSIFVPADETCFHLLSGPSAEAVAEAAARAAVRVDRIVEAVESGAQ